MYNRCVNRNPDTEHAQNKLAPYQEENKSHRHNQQCQNNKVVLGRTHQPPQRRPMDLTRQHLATIYTTKIDGVVCPPNISETVAGRLMKLAHRPRIASTIIKLISKPILLPILLILVKTIQRIVADPKRFSQS